jgi:hypothetical protein
LASLAWLGGAGFVLTSRFGSFSAGLPESWPPSASANGRCSR